MNEDLHNQQLELITALNDKFKNDEKLTLNDFHGITDARLFNERAVKGLIDFLGKNTHKKDLAGLKPAIAKNLLNLAKERKDYMQKEVPLVAGSSVSGITGYSNMNWLSNVLKEKKKEAKPKEKFTPARERNKNKVDQGVDAEHDIYRD